MFLSYIAGLTLQAGFAKWRERFETVYLVRNASGVGSMLHARLMELSMTNRCPDAFVTSAWRVCIELSKSATCVKVVAFSMRTLLLFFYYIFLTGDLKI